MGSTGGTLGNALDLIQSDKVKDRKDGLNQIKHIFRLYQSSPEINKITEDSFHALFEGLFLAVTREKATYLRSAKARQQEPTESRLSTCADALRSTIEASLPRLRPKTINALTKHFLQILPNTDDKTLFEPLCNSYLKSLAVVLTYTPHVEHLAEERWHDLVDLCLAGIKAITDAHTSIHLGALDTLGSRQSQATIRRTNVDSMRSGALFECLKHLVTDTNHNILPRAQLGCDTMFAYLDAAPPTAHVPDLFVTLRHCLHKLSLDSVSTACSYLPRAVSAIATRWKQKSSEMRDEMLKIFILLQDHLIHSITGTGTETESIIQHLGELYDELIEDYVLSESRQRRNHLRLEDLTLNVRISTPSDILPMQGAALILRQSSVESDHNWSVLYCCALIAWCLDVADSHAVRSSRSDSPTTPRKRRKRGCRLQEGVRKACTVSEQISVRIRWMQVVVMTTHTRSLTAAQLHDTIIELQPLISNSSSLLASWTFLALSGCATQNGASNHGIQKLWSDAWTNTFKLISSSTHCRTACHALATMLRQQLGQSGIVSDSADALMAIGGLNHPALLCDSSLAFWREYEDWLHLHRPGGTAARCNEEQTTWLLAKWTPSTLENRGYATQCSQILPARHLISSLLALPETNKTGLFQTPLLHPLGQTWLERHRDRDLLEYLIMTEDLTSNPVGKQHLPKLEPPLTPAIEAGGKLSWGNAIVAKLSSELEKTIDTLQNMPAKGLKQLPTESLLLSLALYLTIECTSHHPATRSTAHGRLSDRQGELENLIWGILSSGDDQETIHAAGAMILEVLSCTCGSLFTSDQVLTSGPLISATFLRRARQELQRYFQRLDAPELHDSDELDDMEIDGHGSDSQRPSLMRPPLELRTILELDASPGNFFIRTTANFALSEALLQSSQEAMEMSWSLIDYLLTLAPANLLGSCYVFRRLENSQWYLSIADATRLLGHLAEECIEKEAYSRCEPPIVIVARLLKMTIPTWTDSRNASVSSIGGQIYSWLVRASENVLRSTRSQQAMSDLLIALFKFKSDYEPSADDRGPKPLPAIRTSILRLLSRGNSAVQYHLAHQLPDLFSVFVISQHDLIFDDVLRNLPKNEDSVEGLAIRVLSLSLLASRWSTLLRKCVYHIFETAARVQSSMAHAKYCLDYVARQLGLTSPRDIFALQNAQIIYTWTSENSIETIPYTVFGFETIQGLMQHSEAEFASQMVMRGFTERFDEMRQALSVSAETLVRHNFIQAVTYCIAADVSTTGPDGKGSHVNENRLVNLVGKHSFRPAIEKDFPLAVAMLLLRTEHEEYFEKALIRKNLSHALKAFHEMKQDDVNEEALPAGQQPSFKTRYFLEALERLCRRATRDLSKMWTASLTTLVLRKLFDDMQPALGQYHLRRGLRRVRMAVCLAGSAVMSGYALELLLHSLRRFLINSHCATEAIGIYKYLLDRGQKSLSQRYSFVAGTSISIYLGLRRLLQSAQDSTTQESQHRAMLTAAQAFHEWLTSWLDHFMPSEPPQDWLKNFRALREAAKGCTGPGSSSVNRMHESNLFKRLLEDALRSKSVLMPRHRDMCLQELCEHFEPAQSYRDDICSRDSQAARISTVLWNFNQRTRSNTDLTIWIAKILARSYRYRGASPVEMMPESIATSAGLDRDGNRSVLGSRGAIINYFLDALQSEHHDETVIAEYTLRRISANTSKEELSVVGEPFQEQVMQALDANCGLDDEHSTDPTCGETTLESAFASYTNTSTAQWLRNTELALLLETGKDPMLNSIVPAIRSGAASVSFQLFPYIFHCTVDALDEAPPVKDRISKLISDLISHEGITRNECKREVIRMLLYLWSQPYPGEKTRLDRTQWLSLDLVQAARAAAGCRMFKSALYFAELSETLRSHQSRRASARMAQVPDAVLLCIFRNIDEPDAFHGVVQTPDLDSVADRFAFEGLGSEELLLRGAQSDSEMRIASNNQRGARDNVINSLARLNMSSLTYDLGVNHSGGSADDDANENIIRAATRLKQWDVTLPVTGNSPSTSLYHAYQEIQQTTAHVSIAAQLRKGMSQTMAILREPQNALHSLQSCFMNLVALNEADEILSARNESEYVDAYERLNIRPTWTEAAKLEDISNILASRETLLSILSNDTALQRRLGISRRVAKLDEIKANLKSSELLRSLGSIQPALNNVAYLARSIPVCKELGLNVDFAVRSELSNVFWDKGELLASVQILKDIDKNGDFASQTITVGRAGLLATLAHRVSEARLEKPDEILHNYLGAAQKELKDKALGSEAGRVYHELATYCHSQLANAELANEFKRLQKFVTKRTNEVDELESIVKSKAPEEQRLRAKYERGKAKKWLEMDGKELKRLSDSRDKYMRQSLENYTLALSASNEHDTDVLRFVALWLEYAADDTANETASNGLNNVPVYKLAPLMNQLASRLQQEDSPFQQTMSRLVEQICVEHPYHGMYHIYAGCTTKGGNDPSAISRNAAAQHIASRLAKHPKQDETWKCIRQANDLYCSLASYKTDSLKSGHEYQLQKFSASKNVERNIPDLKVPPLTLAVPLRTDRDYSGVPVVTKFRPNMSIANGLSAPKILTAVASDGSQCKQLFKAGSDDLRQDAIMEQVFEQVSSLLHSTRVTRQRNLRIRTYKVVPLSATSGAIEFVPNTMALLDYVKTAHMKYHPKDVHWEKARAHIDSGRGKGPDSRLNLYKQVTDKFHPILRHFFFENFEDPEEWFAQRLAYTRSTASISILGHALGLGDRHCQNILLDKGTGEVVHIDLGVAFEAGRILAIPEVVPFRLTRDIVDGMGIMGVEGVFRRCCEFTLEALRNNRDAIMTLLNVLRYDPLYSWSLSPLRARRLQHEQKDKELSEQQLQPLTEGKTSRRSTDQLAALARTKSKSENDEEARDGGEADRALSVVEKKLSPTLSLSATVNELIQQATDERNLALLFCGWAAWA